MHDNAERKKALTEGFTLSIPAPKMGNLFSIAGQIMLKARAKRHDKSNTRMKRKWRNGD
jgi:hypothetical protein